MEILQPAWSLPFLLSVLPAIQSEIATVVPTAETAPIPASGDSADDVALWVHPTDRSLSTVIGSVKNVGLFVYDLNGKELQSLPDGKVNNVDIRYGFPLADQGTAIVTAGERNQNVLLAYAVDPASRRLHRVAARAIKLGVEVEGCCMYRSRKTGDTYFIVNSKEGHVEQWRLYDDGTGRIDATRVRDFDVGNQVEGCVADDEAGFLFIAEEAVGIWRYGAEPDDGSARVQVDRTGPGGHLAADVEGLSIYHACEAGYLIASSQGDSTYVVYDRRPPHQYRLKFRIGDNVPLDIDGTSETDGIDVTNLGLGEAFPSGVFVAQDDENPGAGKNFKLVPWQAIANAAKPPLLIDSSYDPHGTDRQTLAAKAREGVLRR